VATTIISGWRSPPRLSGGQLQQPPAAGPSQQRLGQREDRQRGDAQHDDLAEGVEAAEVDEDHVDDVGAAAARVGNSRGDSPRSR
jgi:hypothetical protein